MVLCLHAPFAPLLLRAQITHKALCTCHGGDHSLRPRTGDITFPRLQCFWKNCSSRDGRLKEKKKAKWLTRLRMHDEWSDGSFDCRRACGGKNAGAGNLVRTGASCQLHCCNFTLLCNRPTVPLGTTTFRRHGIGELVPSEVMPGFRCVGRLTQVHVSAS